MRLTVGRPTLLKCWPTPVLFCQMIELNLKRETLRWTISILDIYIYIHACENCLKPSKACLVSRNVFVEEIDAESRNLCIAKESVAFV